MIGAEDRALAALEERAAREPGSRANPVDAAQAPAVGPENREPEPLGAEGVEQGGKLMGPRQRPGAGRARCSTTERAHESASP